MLTLTLERARAIVAHAHNEFAASEYIPDAFAPFARGGASTREEATIALYIFIADFYRAASRHGVNSPAMQEFSKYANMSVSIAMRINYDAVEMPVSLGLIPSFDSLETIDSFVCYLRTLNPRGSDFMSNVYLRLGVEYPEQSRECGFISKKIDSLHEDEIKCKSGIVCEENTQGESIFKKLENIYTRVINAVILLIILIVAIWLVGSLFLFIKNSLK